MFDVFGQREQAFLKVRILMDFEYLFSFESMGSQLFGLANSWGQICFSCC
jgi:hypothetical protein